MLIIGIFTGNGYLPICKYRFKSTDRVAVYPKSDGML